MDGFSRNPAPEIGISKKMDEFSRNMVCLMPRKTKISDKNFW